MEGLRTEIQRIVFPPDTRNRDGYLSFKPPAESPPGKPPVWEGRSLLLSRGWTAILDGPLNRLSESAWAPAGIEELALSAVVSGVGTLEVLRRLPGGDERVLSSQAFDTPAAGAQAAEVTCEVTAPDPAEAGALCLRLTADGDFALLAGAAWSVAGGVPVPPQVAVGVCGSRCDPTPAAEAIVRDAAACGIVSAAVTSGDPATAFARLCLAAREETHILLVDADAGEEPDLAFRALRLAAFVPEAVVGALPPDAADLALAGLKPCRLLDERREASGLLLVPVAAVRAVGLPLPLGRDGAVAEYLARLSRAGFPVAALPGMDGCGAPPVCDAEEPLAYVRMRDRLIAASLVGGEGPVSRARGVFAAVLHLLLVFDYGGAALACRAVRDWLRGPVCLDCDPGELDAALRAEARQYGQPTLADGAVQIVSHPQANPLPAGKSRGRILAGLVLESLTTRKMDSPPTLPVPGFPPEFADPWVVFHGWDLAIRPPVSDGRWRWLHRSRRRFRRMLPRVLALAVRLAVQGPFAVRRWRRAAGRLAGSGAWRKRLDPEQAEARDA